MTARRASAWRELRPTAFAFTEILQVVTDRWGQYTASGGRRSKGSRARGCIRTAGSPGRLPHPGDFAEVGDERLHAAAGLAPVVVLVRCVVAVLGEAQADEHDRGLQVLLHGDHGADRAALADEGGGPAEAEVHRIAGGV